MLFGGKKRTIFDDPQQVEQMLQHLGRISEQMDEGIAIVDNKGVVHFANTAWATMHGYKTSGELLGKSITFFHTQAQMKNEYRPFVEQSKRRDKYRAELSRARADGTTFISRTKMVVLKDRRGRYNGLMIYAMDITEAKKNEEALKTATEQVEKLRHQLDKLQCQISERSRTENELQEYCDHLEEYVEEHGGDAVVVEKAVAESSTPVEEVSAQQTDEAAEPEEFVLPLRPEKLKAISDLAKKLQ